MPTMRKKKRNIKTRNKKKKSQAKTTISTHRIFRSTKQQTKINRSITKRKGDEG